MNDALHDLLFGVRRSIRYHVRRRMFFDRFNLTASAVALIFGSAAMAAILGDFGRPWGALAALAVTIFSAINLVVGAARMARLHADLARRFVELEQQIVLADAQAESALPRFTALRLGIEAEEPPVLRVLDCLCHNELMRAMGYPPEDLLRIRWHQRLLAQIIDVGEHGIAVPVA